MIRVPPVSRGRAASAPTSWARRPSRSHRARWRRCSPGERRVRGTALFWPSAESPPPSARTICFARAPTPSWWPPPPCSTRCSRHDSARRERPPSPEDPHRRPRAAAPAPDACATLRPVRWLVVLPFERPGLTGMDFADELRRLGHEVRTFEYRKDNPLYKNRATKGAYQSYILHSLERRCVDRKSVGW